MCELEVVQELRGIYQAAARAQEAPATQYPHTHTQPPTVPDTSATHIHDTDPYQDSDDSADNQELQAAVYEVCVCVCVCVCTFGTVRVRMSLCMYCEWPGTAGSREPGTRLCVWPACVCVAGVWPGVGRSAFVLR